MIHAEMVFVVPVLAFTFLVMGWIVSQFRGYLAQRADILADMEARHAPVPEVTVHEIYKKAA